MKSLFPLLIVATALLLMLSACESGAKFRVINACSYPAYVRIDSGAKLSIPAGGSQEFSIDTGTKTPFSGEVNKDIRVWLVGETYSLFDPDTNQYLDSTWVTLTAGKTLEAYLNPNRASIKITNSSSQTITSATIWQHGGVNVLQMGILEGIAPGESRFFRVPYGSGFYYQVAVITQEGLSYLFGDTTTVLAKDQQFHVLLTDPVNK